MTSTGPLELGQKVDRFTVVQLLGVGGMAAVYGVRHSTLGTQHALKVLTLRHKEVQDRLVQEGKLQASLQHPHIVSVTDVIDLDGQPCLVMAYVDGLPMDQWLAHHEPSLEEALAVFRGIARGVQYAHEKDVVHRDLKPGNVLLALGEGGRVIPQVMDFGLAKSYTRRLRRGETQAGRMMGTPAYMPPEQISDASTVDRRADVYALGCILYQLVAGRPPYLHTDMVALFAAIAAGDHPSVLSLVPDLPVPLVDAIEGAMVRDRSDRIGDVASLIEVLDGRSSLHSLTGMVGRDTEQGLAPPRPMVESGAHTLAPGSAGAMVVERHARGPLPSVDSAEGEPADPGTATLEGFAPLSPLPPSATGSRPSLLAASVAGGFGLGIGIAALAGVLLVGGLGLLVWRVGASEGPPVDAPPTLAVPTAIPEPAPMPVGAAPQPVPTPPAPQPAPTDPRVEPTPAKPRPAPVPVPLDPVPPAPAPDPEPPADPPRPPATFAWKRHPGLTRVLLVGEDGSRHAEGRLPAGHYKIWVETVDLGKGEWGTITLAEGQTAMVVCNPDFGSCR